MVKRTCKATFIFVYLSSNHFKEAAVDQNENTRQTGGNEKDTKVQRKGSSGMNSPRH